MTQALHLVVMGVSGVGKTLIGEKLSVELSYPFTDGDNLHSQANRKKMSECIPLTDDDRWPWLDEVAKALNSTKNHVIACSALKKVYRERIFNNVPNAKFIHLSGNRDAINARLKRRQGHFMPVALLDSQISALEPLAADEAGITLNAELTPDYLVKKILIWLNSFDY